MRKTLQAVLVAGSLFFFHSNSQAQDSDIQTNYVTEKGACSSSGSERIEISDGKIAGPGFGCSLSNSRPAGTGLVAYDAVCTIDGNEITGILALDLGNFQDHFKLSIPTRDAWISLYPCTPVPGLN